MKEEQLNETIMNLVEQIRLADDLDKSQINNLYSLLNQFCDEYQHKKLVPKDAIYCLIVLRDNLEGALKHAKGDDLKNISEISSKVDSYIERLFLS